MTKNCIINENAQCHNKMWIGINYSKFQSWTKAFAVCFGIVCAQSFPSSKSMQLSIEFFLFIFVFHFFAFWFGCANLVNEPYDSCNNHNVEVIVTMQTALVLLFTVISSALKHINCYGFLNFSFYFLILSTKSHDFVWFWLSIFSIHIRFIQRIDTIQYLVQSSCRRLWSSIYLNRFKCSSSAQCAPSSKR